LVIKFKNKKMTTKTFNTIHIFGFGNVQVIGKDFNHQVKISDVQSEVDACVTMVYSKKPTESTTPNTYHAINIFNDMFADWLSNVKGEKGFRVKYSDLDSQVIEALVEAVIAFATPKP
jgi:hypothetical protein